MPPAICHVQMVRLPWGLAVMVLAAAVCTEVAVAAPTRAEFIRKGDAVCVQTKRELVPIRRRAEAAKLLPQAQQWAATAGIWADQIVIQKRFLSRFRAIGMPDGDLVARALVAKIGRGVTLAQRVQQGFATRNTVSLQTALPAYLRFTVDLNKRVVAYGFRTCGR